MGGGRGARRAALHVQRLGLRIVFVSRYVVTLANFPFFSDGLSLSLCKHVLTHTHFASKHNGSIYIFDDNDEYDDN